MGMMESKDERGEEEGDTGIYTLDREMPARLAYLEEEEERDEEDVDEEEEEELEEDESKLEEDESKLEEDESKLEADEEETEEDNVIPVVVLQETRERMDQLNADNYIKVSDQPEEMND